MVAYVNIIRSINALPLDHTKARTLWLKCESGEEIKIKINGCLPYFLHFLKHQSIGQPYLFSAESQNCCEQCYVQIPDRRFCLLQKFKPVFVKLLIIWDKKKKHFSSIMFIMLIIIEQLPRSLVFR